MNEFLTVQETAALLNCSTRTVYRYLQKQLLTAKTVYPHCRLVIEKRQIKKLKGV